LLLFFRSLSNEITLLVFKGAIDAYTKAIDLFPDPDSPKLAVYFSNRALAQQKFANLGSAVLDGSRATELDPEYAKAYFRRGTVLKQLGKIKEAFADFRFAQNLEPANREVRNQVRDLEVAVRKLVFEEAIAAGKEAETAQIKRKAVASTKKTTAREWDTTTSLAVLASRCIADEVTKMPEEFEPFLREVEEVYLAKILPWLGWSGMQFFRNSASFAKEFTSGKINAFLKMQDDFYRKLLASDRNSPILNDPHLNLIDPFDPVLQPYMRYMKPDFEEAAQPRLFPQQVLREGPAFVTQIEEFESKLDIFANGELKYLDWTNVFVAGGSVLAALVPTPGGVRVDDNYLENPAYKGAYICISVRRYPWLI
jgi:hypothetical protein